MRWHNGRTRRSPNPNSEEVLRDCVIYGERSAAHSILARSPNSNKGRIHLRRPNLLLSLFACSKAADHTFRVGHNSPGTQKIFDNSAHRAHWAVLS
jgi:hypothetical protein